MADEPTVSGTGPGLAVRQAADARTILAQAGRPDLADIAWRAMCPAAAPGSDRVEALLAAGWRPTRADAGARPAS